MFQSLQLRINMISLFSGLIVAAGLAGAGARIIALQYTDALHAHSQQAADEIAVKVQRLRHLGLSFHDTLGFEQEWREAVAHDGKLFFAGIYDREGSPLFESAEIDVEHEVIKQSLLASQFNAADNHHLFFIHPLNENTELNEGYIAIAAKRSVVREAVFSSLSQFLWLATLLILAGLVIHYLWLQGSVIQPLRRLVSEVKAVEPGNFCDNYYRKNVGRGEIGELAGAFSKLLRELDKTQQEVVRQAERALKVEKRLNKTIVQSSPLAIYTRDKNGLVTGWNAACERIFGWTEAEVLGKPLPTIPVDKRDESAGLRQQLLAGQPNIQIEGQRFRRDGSVVDLLITLSPLYGEAGEIEGVLAIATDITERKAAEKRIEFLAHHDALTGLPNRRLIQARFEQALAFAARDGKRMALVFMDLDHFKAINDTLGHAAGDAYLQEIAKRLSSAVRSTDILSRQGGDEFLLVLSSLGDDEDIPPILSKLAERLHEPVHVAELALGVSISIGVAIYPQDGDSFDELLKKADMAMYRAKQEGRNTYRFYHRSMDIGALRQHFLRNDLMRALEGEEFVLHYQPLRHLRTDKVTEVEALIRWNHPKLGLLLPAEFIALAEESGVIVRVGNWVIREACRQLAHWRQAGWDELAISVNLSPVQMMSNELEPCLAAALTEFALPPHLLELEIDESLLAQHIHRVQETLSRLKALGVTLTIDKFGAGYSSLLHLKKLAVDKVKIDGSYVRDLVSKDSDQTVVTAILQMARSLDLTTVAGGIESADVLHHLEGLHCDVGQGYYFAKPMAAREAEAYIRDMTLEWKGKDRA